MSADADLPESLETEGERPASREGVEDRGLRNPGEAASEKPRIFENIERRAAGE